MTRDWVPTGASIELFRRYLLQGGRTERTARAYTSDLTGMMKWVASRSADFASLDEAARGWLDVGRSEGRAPRTLSRRAASLRSYGSWAGTPVLDCYRLPAVVPSRPHPLPGGMSDVATMLDSCDTDDDLAMVALCCLAGLRISEARAMKRETIVDGALVVLGKGYKVRRVPVSSTLAPILERIHRKPGEPFIRLSDSGARRRWRQIAEKAQIPGRSSTHDGRATLATDLLGRTGNLRLAQEVLGHASVATTQIYTGVTEQQMREALA